MLCLCFCSQPPALALLLLLLELLLLLPQLLLQICYPALLCIYVLVSLVQAVLQ
jgi:hypothetical protein